MSGDEEATEQELLDWTECMQGEGVDIPDPVRDANGDLVIDGNGIHIGSEEGGSVNESEAEADGEEPAVELPTVEREAKEARVFRTELHLLGADTPVQGHHESVVHDERLIAVLRDRAPQEAAVAVGEAGPRPLARVPVPIADEHVEEACLEVLARVGAVARPLLERVEERVGAHDPR